MEKDIPKIHLALGGAAYLFLIDLLCTSSLYFLNVYLAWTIAIVGSIALLIPVAKMFDTLTVWLGIIAIAVIALSYFKSEDLKIITGDKEKVLSLKSFKSNENIRTYIFQDVKVLTNYKHLKTIVKVTRNKNGTSRTTNFHYIAPLVEKNWEEGDPIPAWVVATTSPNRKAWMRPGSNTGVLEKRDEDWEKVVAETKNKFMLREANKAPLFQLFESEEELISKKTNIVKAMTIAFPSFWFICVLLFYWPSSKRWI